MELIKQSTINVNISHIITRLLARKLVRSEDIQRICSQTYLLSKSRKSKRDYSIADAINLSNYLGIELEDLINGNVTVLDEIAGK